MFWIKHRRLILFSVYALLILHAILWYCLGYKAVGQLGFGDFFYTLKTGLFTAGSLFVILVFAHAVFFGGIFCGWFCHWGITQDIAAWIMEKVGIKPIMRNLDSKLVQWVWFIVLIAQVGFHWYFFGFPVTVDFSASHTPVWAGNPTAILMICMTTLISGFILIFLFGERAFCRSICTFRLWFSWFERISPYRVRSCKKCESCSDECTKACFMGIDVAKEIRTNSVIKNTACVKCFKCMGACPNAALTASFKKGEDEKNEKIELPPSQFDLTGSVIQASMAIVTLHFVGYAIGGNMSLSTGFLIGFVMVRLWHTRTISLFEIITIIFASIGLYFGNDTNTVTALIKGLGAIAFFLILARYLGFKEGFSFLDKIPKGHKTSKVLMVIAVALALYAGSIEVLATYNITKANAAITKKDYETYIECMEKWADRHSQPESAYFDLAKVQFNTRRYDKSLESLKKSLDLSYREDLAIGGVQMFLDRNLPMHAKKLALHFIDRGLGSQNLNELLEAAEMEIARRKAAILGRK